MDAATIRDNLEKFATAGGIRIEELSTFSPPYNTEVTLSNGVKMKWNTFLLKASQYLLGTSKRSESPHRAAETLDMILGMIGVARQKQEYLDTTYFDEANKEDIRKDLEAFAIA